MASQKARTDVDAPWWKRAVTALGPGLVTGASDDDPSGIATYAQAGAVYGYSSLWTALVSLPMMIVIQEMCDRTATATGDSLGALVRRRFQRTGRIVVGILLVLLMLANTVNVAADLMAVGQGMQLLGAGPAQLWSPIAGIGLAVLLVTGSYRLVARVFTGLCFALFAYVVVMFFAGVDWGQVVQGLGFLQLRPDLAYWGLIAAVFGTSISPYLFFWESGQRIEELRESPEGGDDAPADPEIPPHQAQRRREQQRIDVVVGMTLSVLVMFAVIVATGATIGRQGQEIHSAAEAAQALSPLAGPLAGLVFALGFIGTGLLAVPVLASSACIGLSALLHKEWGFDRSPRKAPVFYSLLLLGTVAGTVLAVVFPDPIGLLVFSAMLNAVAAAPFLITVLIIAGSRRIMGPRRNRPLSAIVGWATAVVMVCAGVAAIWSQLAG
ncbi:Nramp family divalent metal transporter [Sinomonas sp. JGH33]|uniref:Nramp family divalent metal transporter n=1 Tax=Sinomonas terricola TaxID=3110330 RepID=A0ABU5TAB3_9MICC|nr:Nramp family divalent metal transporter [Sinomonas sp. JGH33]MEA5456449.1 Nramp family divalent metal transporter [Sinomonas sp. JGH33]